MVRRSDPHYLRPWTPGDREATIKSASAAARFALSDCALTDTMRQQILTVACWAVTEVDGKYGTRYRTRSVLALEVAPGEKWQRFVQHEHVITRQSLIRRMREGEAPETVLAEATACLVTAAEHAELKHYDKTHIGWNRYRVAGLEVIDMATGEPFVLPDPT